MGRLNNKAPTEIEVCGQRYAIETDYRVCLDTALALADKSLTPTEKLDILLDNIYNEIPDNLEAAAGGALIFLACGSKQNPKREIKLCDFEQDGDYIYSAMLLKGVDLDKADEMHWWTFMAHMSELPESMFRRIVYLRSQRSRGKLTKDERNEITRLGSEVIDFHGEDNEQERIEIEKLLSGD